MRDILGDLEAFLRGGNAELRDCHEAADELAKARAAAQRQAAVLNLAQAALENIGVRHDELASSNERLRAALERITRECGALNKGPVAVEIARDALVIEAEK